jgi:hypothetical protein
MRAERCAVPVATPPCMRRPMAAGPCHGRLSSRPASAAHHTWSATRGSVLLPGAARDTASRSAHRVFPPRCAGSRQTAGRAMTRSAVCAWSTTTHQHRRTSCDFSLSADLASPTTTSSARTVRCCSRTGRAIRCAGCVTMIHARVGPSGASESDGASAGPGYCPCEQAQRFGPVVVRGANMPTTDSVG